MTEKIPPLGGWTLEQARNALQSADTDARTIGHTDQWDALINDRMSTAPAVALLIKRRIADRETQTARDRNSLFAHLQDDTYRLVGNRGFVCGPREDIPLSDWLRCYGGKVLDWKQSIIAVRNPPIKDDLVQRLKGLTRITLGKGFVEAQIPSEIEACAVAFDMLDAPENRTIYYDCRVLPANASSGARIKKPPPRRSAVKQAINTLWPDGIPDGYPWKRRDQEIIDHLGFEVSPSTIRLAIKDVKCA